MNNTKSVTYSNDAKKALKLYIPGEVADLLHMKQETIRRWINQGEFGDVVKVGRSKLVTEAGLQAYLAAHTGPAAEPPKETAWRRKTRKPGADVMAKI